MKRFITITFISMIAVIIAISCNRNAENPTTLNASTQVSNFRINFSRNKTQAVLKDDYRSLTISKQKELWLDKLNQIKTQTLSSKQLNLINELEIVISGKDDEFISSNQKIKNLGIDLALITPREDFIQMFSSLENYIPNTGISTEICNECISDLKNESIISDKSKVSFRLGGCNCKWTCGWGPYVSSSNCTPTDTGCGFL